MEDNVIVTIAAGGAVTIVKDCTLYDLEAAAQTLQQFVNTQKQKTMVKVPTPQNETDPEERKTIAQS